MNQHSLARASAERKSLDSMASEAVAVVVAVVAVVVDVVVDVAIDSFPADLRDDVEPPSLALPSSEDESGAGACWYRF